MTVKNNTVALTATEVARLNAYQKSELEMALEAAGYTMVIKSEVAR